MRARVARTLAVVRDVVPLRIGGALLLGLGLFVALRFSKDNGDYLLRPAALVVSALVLLCVALVTLGTLMLRRELRGMAAGVGSQLETGHASLTSFRVPRLRRWVVLDVDVRWVDPPGVHIDLEPKGPWLEETATPTLRGRHVVLTRRFTVEDVFGLAGLSFQLSWPVELRIAPASTAWTGEVISSRATGDTFSNPAGRAEGDLVEMRAYAHGDSMRHVLWKIYARTRRLLVRLPERAQSPQPITIAFLLAGPKDEASAGTARLYVEQGLLGPDFLFSADGAAKPARTREEALEQIIDSGSMRESGGANLEAMASSVEPGRLTACLVFAPPVDGPWRARLSELVARRALSTTVVIGVDQIIDEAPTPKTWRRFLVEPEVREAPADVVALRTALEASGIAVHVVHRGTGRLL
jgi:uncharacterized protein (DUF58 family)